MKTFPELASPTKTKYLRILYFLVRWKFLDKQIPGNGGL